LLRVPCVRTESVILTHKNVNFVVFDLDHTITRYDTFLVFLLCSVCYRPVNFIYLFIFPVIILLNYLRIFKDRDLKENVLSLFFKGMSIDTVTRVSYVVESVCEKIGYRSKALFVLKRHLEDGDVVCIASASIDLYVLPICKALGVEYYCATVGQVEEGVVTGAIDGENCKGRVKLNRVMRLRASLGVEFDNMVAYSDNRTDIRLLRMADQGYMINPSNKIKGSVYGVEFLYW
jgi:phosphatidylglycerophosphatase C